MECYFHQCIKKDTKYCLPLIVKNLEKGVISLVNVPLKMSHVHLATVSRKLIESSGVGSREPYAVKRHELFFIVQKRLE